MPLQEATLRGSPLDLSATLIRCHRHRYAQAEHLLASLPQPLPVPPLLVDPLEVPRFKALAVGFALAAPLSRVLTLPHSNSSPLLSLSSSSRIPASRHSSSSSSSSSRGCTSLWHSSRSPWPFLRRRLLSPGSQRRAWLACRLASRLACQLDQQRAWVRRASLALHFHLRQLRRWELAE